MLCYPDGFMSAQDLFEPIESALSTESSIAVEQELVRLGVIVKTKNGQFKFPIPSMQTWLRNHQLKRDN